MKSEVIIILKNALKKLKIPLRDEEIEKFIEVPKDSEMGDYAFPCFFLAQKLKEDPKDIAIKIREIIGEIPNSFEDIQTIGAYINFFVNRKELFLNTINEVLSKKENYGRNSSGNNQKIVVEFSSPNIAKPFGIGHLRSTIIGNSIANICEFNGYKIIRLNYFGDWGAQFGKLLFGFKKFGNKAKLKKDPVKNLLEIYVKANNKMYESKAREEFKKLEEGDKRTLELWKKFKKLSLNEFEKIYKILGIKFDEVLGESMYNSDMKNVLKALKDGKLLQQSEGALIVDLTKFNLGVCLIEKTDGTTLYATRDLASAISRYNRFKFSKMIYEVGQEQILYLKQVFKILELMGYDWAKNCIHVDHGFYLDKDGKKFATRKGKTVFMEDVLKETISLAEKEIKKRFPKLSKGELQRRANKVAIAAIFYGDLKNNRINNMIFDIDRFVSFEGDTGPYLLYSYARASSILEKAKKQKLKKSEFEDFEE